MKALRGIGVLALIVAVILLGLVLQEDRFWLRVMTLVFITGTVAQSWNLLAGYAGQWSLAQTAFFGIGAYASGIALQRWGVPLLIGLFLGAIATALIAAVIGAVTLRIRGHYFSLITFLLTVALLGLASKYASSLGGAFGLNVPIGGETSVLHLTFPGGLGYYYLAAIVAGLATLVIYLVGRSRLGLLLGTIRDDEEAARAIGVRTLQLKLAAMVIAAFLAGMAGTVYLASYKLMDAATAFGLTPSLDPVVSGILGGSGTLFGGLIGAAILQPILAQTNVIFGATTFGAPQLVYGLVLMLTILFMPKGVAGVAKSVRRLMTGKGGRTSAPRGEPGLADPLRSASEEPGGEVPVGTRLSTESEK